MTSETKATDKPGDPADKAADGAFGGVTTHSHRAGYGDDKLARVIDWLRAHPTTTLASGEGALLLGEIDRLHAAELDGMDHYADARAEIDRMRDDRDNLSSQLRDCTYNHDGWKQRAERFERKIAGLQEESTLVVAERDRLERILAALREPSESVVRAGHEAYVLKIGQIYADEGHVARHHQTLAIDSAIRAAVAVAEQEVGP